MAAYLRIMKELFELKKTMGKDFLECQVAMSAANYAAGDFGVVVRDQVKSNAAVRVRINTENVAGVMKPTFIVKGIDDQNADEDLIGITGGGQAISRTRDNFKKYLKLLIGIASLQTQFTAVERVLKVTKRRVNALEFVVIPRIIDTIKWIESELDELDREDFFRLKVVQDKKKEAKEIDEAEKAAAAAKLKGDNDAEIDEEEKA